MALFRCWRLFSVPFSACGRGPEDPIASPTPCHGRPSTATMPLTRAYAYWRLSWEPGIVYARCLWSLVAMFHPVVHRGDCVRHRGGGRGGRRGIKFSAAPPSPQPGTGGFRESGRPLTAQDLDGLAFSWRLFWAWRTGGSTRVSSERVLQAPGHRIGNISNTIGGGSLAVVHFALPRRHGNSLPPSVPPFHPRRHHPPIPDRPPIGPMPYLIQCHHPHACRRGGVLRREPHGATGLNELTHVVCLAALHPPKTTAAASA